METAIARLLAMKPGFATIMWDMVVIRVGNKYSVGQTASLRKVPYTAEEAAAILCRK